MAIPHFKQFRTGIDKHARVNEMECFRDGRLLIVFPQRDICGRYVIEVKLVICYWPNTGQRVANGTIPLQLRAGVDSACMDLEAGTSRDLCMNVDSY